MNKKILFIFFISISFLLSGQSEKEFGDSLFNALQQDTTLWDNWYINLPEYHKLIESQPMDKISKEEYKLFVNDNFKIQKENFISEMNELRAEYSIDQEDAHYTLTDVGIEAIEQVKDIYYFRLFITYIWKKREDPYVLEFQAALVDGEWKMMEPLQEYHQ